MKYNILNGQGFINAQQGAHGWFGNTSLIKARLAMVIIFFLMAILNKWVFGLMGVAFNMWTASLGGIVGYIIIVSLTGAVKISLAVGIVVGILLGILGGQTIGSTSDAE